MNQLPRSIHKSYKPSSVWLGINLILVKSIHFGLLESNLAKGHSLAKWWCHTVVTGSRYCCCALVQWFCVLIVSIVVQEMQAKREPVDMVMEIMTCHFVSKFKQISTHPKVFFLNALAIYWNECGMSMLKSNIILVQVWRL